ncbi:hypothetical protein HYPSUDRAFT_208874 [Hypholoma sublateritium FD-334 SS-4]|uniref:Uncharacterized protein n=1 Tax=Hypholoma sublateritium (strain FD-334 SS-4) TaxID=945553 RepID=A0A0D2LTV1_HYPSF|nr:hypothetical protein HYPSUDRAFT_208874 [Hypholoma sublateritium FD-334 SS-4]
MSKPTLVQTLFNQPSQSYRPPPDRREYYSTRAEMLRIAAESVPRRPPYDDEEEEEEEEEEEDDDDDSEVDLDVFFTPNQSPRTSMASSSATFRRPSRRSLTADPPAPQPHPLALAPSPEPTAPSHTTAVPSTRTPATATPPATRARHAVSASSSVSAASLDAYSVFSDYSARVARGAQERPAAVGSRTTTYIASPAPAPARSNGAPAPAPAPEKSAKVPAAAAPPPARGNGNGAAGAPKKYATPRQPHTFSAFASISAPPARPPATTTTTTTTATPPTPPSSSPPPPPTANGHAPPPPRARPAPAPAQVKAGARPTSTPAPPTTTRGDSASRPTSGASSARPASSASSASAPRTTSGALLRKPAPALAPAQAQAPAPPHPPAHPPTPATAQSQSHSQSSAHAPTPPKAPPPARKKPPMAKPGSALSALGSAMDALYEEDEDAPPAHAREGSMTPPGWDWGVAPGRGLRHTGVVGVGVGVGGGGGGVGGGVGKGGGGAARRASEADRSSSASSSSSTSRGGAQPKTLAAEAHARAAAFAAAGALPSNGTRGYSALVVPRAPPPASGVGPGAGMGIGIGGKGAGGGGGRVDLTQTGLAQATMASVEVTRGLGARAAGGVLGRLGLARGPSASARASSSHTHPHPNHATAPRTTGAPAKLTKRPPGEIARGVPPISPLAFTAYRAPPGSVPRGGVLVQVWAVALDGVDARLVGAGLRLAEGGAEVVGAAEGEVEAGVGEGAGGVGGEGEGVGEGGVDEADTDDTPSTLAHSSPATTPAKKGALAALGRSLSLRLARGRRPADVGLQRAATAVPSAGKSTQGGGGSGSSAQSTPTKREISHPKRSFSLKRSTPPSPPNATKGADAQAEGGAGAKGKARAIKGTPVAEVGYIPGRAFVGRVLECGWDVGEEVVRKGEWVVGLLDVRKAGALTEFIVVDRHRIQRVPAPHSADAAGGPVWALPGAPPTPAPPVLALAQLALLPLCALPAYRAVRTLVYAFTAGPRAPGPATADYGSLAPGQGAPPAAPGVEHAGGVRRRALVLRGHDGAGALAAQLLAARGWRVSVHVPLGALAPHAPPAAAAAFMRRAEGRARAWGADEVVFDDGEGGAEGAAVRVLAALREDGDVFDAVLDCVGGKAVWAAGERLLRAPGGVGGVPLRRGAGQFTTLVGHTPARVVPSARDNFRAGLRALRMGSGDAEKGGRVGYAWLRPPLAGLDADDGEAGRVWPFAQAPYAFVDGGPLAEGGTVVVRIA